MPVFHRQAVNRLARVGTAAAGREALNCGRVAEVKGMMPPLEHELEHEHELGQECQQARSISVIPSLASASGGGWGGFGVDGLESL